MKERGALTNTLKQNFIKLSIQWDILLNPHSGYVKLDAYLLQFLCHMTSDVKFSNMLFFLVYIYIVFEYYY